MFETEFVGFESSAGSLNLCDVPILVDEGDFEGIRIAAQALSRDLAKVTGLDGNHVVTGLSGEAASNCDHYWQPRITHDPISSEQWQARYVRPREQVGNLHHLPRPGSIS